MKKERESPAIPKSDIDEKDTKITKKDKVDEITTTSKKDNNNDVQDKLPETGKSNDIQKSCFNNVTCWFRFIRII